VIGVAIAWIPTMKSGGHVLEGEHDSSSPKTLYGKHKKKGEINCMFSKITNEITLLPFHERQITSYSS